MENLVKINRSHIEKAKGEKNTPTIDQFKTLGYNMPFLGWEEEILGKEYPLQQVLSFTNHKYPKVLAGKKRDKIQTRSRLKKAKAEAKKNAKNNKAYKPRNPKNKSVKKKTSQPKATNDPYLSEEWILIRNRIYRRDHYTCRACGKEGNSQVKMNVHHLLYVIKKPVWDVPDFYLITLCLDCHKKEHGKRLKAPAHLTW